MQRDLEILTKRRRFVGLLGGFVILVAVGCNDQSATQIELTVSAAASMQDAIKAVGEAYTEEHPNTEINYNLGSSGTLAQQIEQGAPVDVFISANEEFMNTLEEKDLLLPGTRKDLLKNEVVLIVPNNANTPKITDFKDLTSGEVKRFSIGQPESVPAGEYGKEVLTSLNIYNQLEPKTVFAKDVRQVLSYVETGNVDAGVVYATDAQISNGVKVVATAPFDTHKPIIYPAAVLKQTENQDTAKEFVEFLSSDQAKATFEEYGFKMAQ